LTSPGFVINEADRSVYCHHGGGHRVILCLYVDDILIIGTNMDVINDVKSFFSKSFDMKDLGEADVILKSSLLRMRMGLLFQDPIMWRRSRADSVTWISSHLQHLMIPV
jgi:hypothetical protein